MSPTDLTTLRQIESFFATRAGLFAVAQAHHGESDPAQLADVNRHWQQVIARVIREHDDAPPAVMGLDVERQIRFEMAAQRKAWQAVADYAAEAADAERHDYARPHSAGFSVFP